ncbi:hypothetical protein ANCCEY_10864 [Ancylostoma ceylanicum]|uniref:Uncharacterized protein n=1 Tax=Ancylostoma ceylanicum TaxID=53326 RepID=A0A0D6LFT2_9BILA|nr:hypothetical protein ANCCEY_10864 [Ancylostoma ceylanicum]
MNMLLAKRAILALTSYSDGNTQLECMNEPFRDKCSLELLDFQNEKYAAELNKSDLRDLSLFARSQFIDNSIPFETVSLPAELATDYGFDSRSVSNTPALSKGDYTHFGGVSLPAAQKTSSFLWEKIVENAKDVSY